MKTWLRAQLRYLDELGEFDEQVAGELRELVREAGRRAAKAGLPDAVKLCNIRPGGVAPSLAREVLAGCLAACQQEPELLGMKDAARALGCSVSGLRKLVRRKAVQYSQRHKHSAIRFRREWLDAYIAGNAAVRPTIKRKIAATSVHGF